MFYNKFRNSSLFIFDCLIISSNVPLSISLCNGTTKATLPSESSFVMITWLPFCLTEIKPILESVLITSLPDNTGSFANMFYPKVYNDCIIRGKLFW